MSRFHALISLFALLFASASVLAYKLSPSDGQAVIGAYHVQPGRCADVERRLGRATYAAFLRTTPFHTSFAELFSPNPAIPRSDLNPDADSSVSGVGVEQMDATSLCAFNPALTEGYGGGFDKMKLYLVYSRCIYGSDEMRGLCGVTNAAGKPSGLSNLVQAACPSGTKCKNLCATMVNPSLTSPYAAKQVQLAQCMPMDQWQKLTDMYRPKSPGSTKPQAADVHAHQGKVDPIVVENALPKTPATDPTPMVTDGTIPGLILQPAAAGTLGSQNAPVAPPKENQAQPKGASKPADSHQQDPLTGIPIAVDPQTLSAAEGEFGPLAANTSSSSHPTTGAIPASEAPGEQPSQKQQQPEHQKAPTEMGFRKRSLRRRQASHSPYSHLPRH